MYTYYCATCKADYHVDANPPSTPTVLCRNCTRECVPNSTYTAPAGKAAAFWYPRGESADTLAEDKVLDVMAVAFDLWQARHRKYGRGNIATTGAVGCAVRSQDKLARLLNVYLHNSGKGDDETVNDSWLDLINYAVMGYMCHNKTWPEVK
jgi:hypothetical protein